MTADEDLGQAIAGVRTALDGLATFVQTLEDQLNNTAGTSVTAAQLEAHLTSLAALRTAITGISTNPGTPPAPIPTPTPMPGPFLPTGPKGPSAP